MRETILISWTVVERVRAETPHALSRRLWAVLTEHAASPVLSLHRAGSPMSNSNPATPSRGQHSAMWQHSAAIARWLDSHGESVVPPVVVKRVGAGQSNITSLVTDSSGGEWILREPPPGRSTDHDVWREVRIVQALFGTGIPVPHVIGTGCAPHGSPFVVMERAPGRALETENDALALAFDQRGRLGEEVATMLARLHTVDPSVLNLPIATSSYLQRQIRRISDTWSRTTGNGADDALWEGVRTRLIASLPADELRSVVVHGDFRLANLLVNAAQITAVLDWELCTIGNPLADVAWLLDDWRSATDPAIAIASPTRVGGFPPREQMMEIYQQITGTDLSAIDYYRGFSQWKAASILQGVLRRRQAGTMGPHGSLDLKLLQESISSLLRSASAHLDAM